jgi:hypothetical protein
LGTAHALLFQPGAQAEAPRPPTHTHLRVRGRVLLADGVDEGVLRLERQPRHLAHRLGHGCGEEQGLAGAGQVAQDALDGGAEAHLQQLVGLVQHLRYEKKGAVQA